MSALESAQSQLPFKRVAIFAPGLMGGSIALALEKIAPEIEVIIWGRKQESIQPVIDSGRPYYCTTDPCKAATEAQLIILCSPVETMPGLVEKILPSLTSKTIITDVGSTKGWLDEKMTPLLKSKASWCGSHPMTGSEKYGFQAATADLYQNATTILTSNANTNPETIKHLKTFWQALGSNILCMDPHRHDELVAQISHFPHLLAFLTMQCVEDDALKLIGPGFRDFTRIASSPAGMWQKIMMDNRQSIIDLITHYIDSLQLAKDYLKTSNSDELLKIFEAASSKRKSLSIEKK